MIGSSDDDYEVGYKKPPTSTRFQKGQSGNPRGRPKKAPETVASCVAGILGESFQARVNGKLVSMTGEELMARRLIEQALKGDAKAFEKVHQLRAQHAAALEREEEKMRGRQPLVVALVHAKIPEEECYKKPGERIDYNKKGQVICRETWDGYLPDDVEDGGDVDPD
jgi:hypothetical protein